jgi:hypothetical protein
MTDRDHHVAAGLLVYAEKSGDPAARKAAWDAMRGYPRPDMEAIAVKVGLIRAGRLPMPVQGPGEPKPGGVA